MNFISKIDFHQRSFLLLENKLILKWSVRNFKKILFALDAYLFNRYISVDNLLAITPTAAPEKILRNAIRHS